MWKFGGENLKLRRKCRSLGKIWKQKIFWEIGGKFGNEGENWKNLGINQKFETPKNIENLKKKLEIWKENLNLQNPKLKIDNWIIDLI